MIRKVPTKDSTPIAVASRSFSRHPVLRAELQERYADVRFNDEGLALGGDAFVAFARGRRKLITALERIDDATLAALPELEVISKYGVGTDMLDLGAMARRGVRLGWTGGVNRRSVTELALAFMIALLRELPQVDREVSTGTWRNRTGRQLSGRTVGIIGCGHIGKDLTPFLRAFGCPVLAHDILDFPEFYAAHQVEAVGLDDLLRRADIVSLHVPLDDSTRGMLERRAAGAHAARRAAGQHGARRPGRRAGAQGDAAGRPPRRGRLRRVRHRAAGGRRSCSPFPTSSRTPHIGGSSEEAILAMGRAAIAGLDDNRLPGDD